MVDAPSRPLAVCETTGLARLFGQMLRYGLNCGVVLVVKLLLTAAITIWLTPVIAYLCVHVVTFFVSYAIHARATFGVAYSWAHVRKYFSAVIGFKLLDYLVFTVLLSAFHIDAILCVVLASVAVMLLRFMVVRKILNHPESQPGKGRS